MFQTNRKRMMITLGFLASVLFLALPPVFAGGWAAVTLDSLPEAPEAGEELRLGFMVRQHGVTPVHNSIQPYLTATHQETGESLQVQARHEGPAGHFVVEVTFPNPGIWRWHITPAPFPAIQPEFEPLTVLPASGTPGEAVANAQSEIPAVTGWPILAGLLLIGGLAWMSRRGTIRYRTGAAAGIAGLMLLGSIVVAGSPIFSRVAASTAAEADTSATNPAPDAAYGKALFAAKGCPVCHIHAEFSNSIPGPLLGPTLTHYQPDPDFLRRWLRNPQEIQPDAAMPDLSLDEHEIEALIAFLETNIQTEPESLMPSAPEKADLPEPAGAPASQPIDAPPIELFFVRAQGAKGPLVVYGMPGGQEQFHLPAGMPSADQQTYYAARVDQANTALEVYDPASGSLERSFSFADQWSLSGVSPSGRWLALTRIVGEREKEKWTQAKQWQTDIQIVDSNSGQIVHSLQLEGNFEVETISAAGDALFLIEHLPAVNPTQYLVRLYDLAAERLQPGALRAKTATDELMTGLAWGGLASSDGRWLLTLYLNTQRNRAFIHALNLEDRFPLCIELPSGDGDLNQFKHYALALSADGRRVYAANAALGIVAEISLDSFETIRTAQFSASALPESTAGFSLPTNYSVLSADGQTLYFTGGWDIWGYDTISGQVSGPYFKQAGIKGLGLSKDKQQLYVAFEKQSPLAVVLTDQLVLNSK